MICSSSGLESPEGGSGCGRRVAVLLSVALTAVVAALAAPCAAADGVILLHGLARTDRSMAPMAAELAAAGFAVVNVDYPSREGAVEDLATAAIAPALADVRLAGSERIHFVTHSMGGILVRHYLAAHEVPRLGRVVMLGPPNQGSEVVDELGELRLFTWINGPAGRQLGTGPTAVPNRLGPVDYPVGVIAGDRSINWINSAIIDGPDDGKVSVERTRVGGMGDHLVIHAAHPFLAADDVAIRETIRFLRAGRFGEPQ